MALSGTYLWGPNLGQIFLNAYSRIGVKRTEIVPQHLDDALYEANAQQAEWSNSGIMLWLQDLQTFNMVAGQATYSVPATTVMITDLFIGVGPDPLHPNNRLITPFSRTDYASLSNPLSPGFPTSYFFLKNVTPTITFYPVPDNNNTYTVNFWRYRILEDAVAAQGGNPDIQYLFTDAYTAGMAHRLSRHYAPPLEQIRKADYDTAFQLAMKQNSENVPLYISVGLSGFYR